MPHRNCFYGVSMFRMHKFTTKHIKTILDVLDLCYERVITQQKDLLQRFLHTIKIFLPV